MKRENNRTNWILRLACVLFCLTMLTTCLTGGLFARYTATFEGSDSARVARFVFDVADKTNRYVDLTEITEPGDSEQYVFVVTNTDGNVSEVEQTYQIAMELAGSLPLECKLTGGDGITLTGNGEGTGAQHTMKAAVEENVEYTLTVSWPEGENDIAYSRAGLSQLVVSIGTMQVD